MLIYIYIYIYNYIITPTSSLCFIIFPLYVLKQLANTITPLFSTIIIDLLNNCEIPKFLESSLICPTIRRQYLDYNDFGNCLSMLHIMGKLFDKNISKQLINYINDNNIIDVYQSEYKKLHITETALLATMNDIYFSLDKHNRIQLLQPDLSSSFDSISHDIIINNISQQGITGDALKILIQLIKDRTYSVKIHNCI